MTYTLDPPGPYDPGTEDYTVTVTATLADGLKWGTMPPAGSRRRPDDGDVYVVELTAGVVRRGDAGGTRR